MIVDTREMSLAEAERLVKLCQECAEVVQAATKALLYGWAPHFQNIQYNNRADVEMELGDVYNVGKLMHERGDITSGNVQTYAELKYERMMNHLRYQHEPEPEEPELVTYFE